jgi:hypothetical protein
MVFAKMKAPPALLHFQKRILEALEALRLIAMIGHYISVEDAISTGMLTSYALLMFLFYVTISSFGPSIVSG